MAPTKVIVQGIPLDHDDCEYPKVCLNRDKSKLERLFETYGPVKCTYLWTDQHHFAFKRKEILDNFAHVYFINHEDSVRASQAASNHELQFGGCTLTLTPVPDSWVPIDNLDDDSLIKIFSKLDLEDRLRIEEVCPHWEEVALHSWSTMKKLDYSLMTVSLREFETYLTRCGRYLEEIISSVQGTKFLDLIPAYCERIKAVDITIPVTQDQNHWQYEFTRMLRRLEDLNSLKLTHYFHRLSFDFLHDLSGSIQNISVMNESGITRCPVPILDFSRFEDLRSLTIKGYDIGDLHGMRRLTKLSHLEFRDCQVSRNAIGNIENLSTLKTLRIPGQSINIDDDTLIKIIRNLRELECLDISGHWNLSDRSVQMISMLPNLKILNVSGLPYVTLRFMDRMSSLEKLECRGPMNITEEAVCRLLELAPNLQYLDVVDCSITTNLFMRVNSVVESRKGDVALKIISSADMNPSEIGQLSPLLEIEYNQGNIPVFEELDEESDDSEFDVYINLRDFIDEDGFKML